MVCRLFSPVTGAFLGGLVKGRELHESSGKEILGSGLPSTGRRKGEVGGEEERVLDRGERIRDKGLGKVEPWNDN